MKEKTIHILRYGTVAEKMHLEKALGAYDYLSINGNTAAYVSNAISQFIVDKFFSKPEKGFFIDPITYAFQSTSKVNTIDLLYNKKKDTGEKILKKSIEKLIEKYGGPVLKIKDGETISPKDFFAPNTFDIFCENVLNFQYRLIAQHIQDNDLGKYITYVSKNDLPQLHPKFLIAPYFYINADDIDVKEWIDLNIKFADKAISLSGENFNNCPIFAQLTINKNIFQDNELLLYIINEYNKLNLAGLTIWVDDLNEHEATADELYSFTMLLKNLKCKTKYNMYGGYFSIMLTHKEIGLLNGVSHGLEYGESRKVYPVGGGLPVSKYYFFPIHKRMDFTDSFYMLEGVGVINSSALDWGDTSRYYNQICKCDQCKTVLKSEMINFIEFESREFYDVKRKNQVLRRKKASSDTKQNCLYHYLLCKMREFKSIEKDKLEELNGNLLTQYDTFKRSSVLLKDDNLEYLKIWNSILKDYE